MPKKSKLKPKYEAALTMLRIIADETLTPARLDYIKKARLPLPVLGVIVGIAEGGLIPKIASQSEAIDRLQKALEKQEWEKVDRRHPDMEL